MNQDHLAAPSDGERDLYAAYAEGRKDEREALERFGILIDCPACNGVGERPVFDTSMGPDAGDGGVQSCPDCDGTGYAKPASAARSAEIQQLREALACTAYDAARAVLEPQQ